MKMRGDASGRQSLLFWHAPEQWERSAGFGFTCLIGLQLFVRMEGARQAGAANYVVTPESLAVVGATPHSLYSGQNGRGTSRCGLSGLRPEVSEGHAAVDMLCTVVREVTYVRGSIPAHSIDCRRHACCYLLAYREWRPQCMERA
jgi:hypothetical protein